MARLSFAALTKAQDNLKTNDFDKELLKAKNLDESGTYVRLVYDERLGEMFYREVTTYWIDGKPFISPATFGEPCPIAEEVEIARGSGDRTLRNLLKSKKFSERTEYYMPVLLLDYIKEVQGGRPKITDIKLKDTKILVAGKQLTQAMVRELMNEDRLAEMDCPDEEVSIIHEELGYNFKLTKEGTGMNTKYDATTSRQMSILDMEFTMPDVDAYVQGELKDEDELRDAIRTYLYGKGNGAAPEADAEEAQLPKATATGQRRKRLTDVGDE